MSRTVMCSCGKVFMETESNCHTPLSWFDELASQGIGMYPNVLTREAEFYCTDCIDNVLQHNDTRVKQLKNIVDSQGTPCCSNMCDLLYEIIDLFNLN